MHDQQKMSEPKVENVVGATLFFGYIAAALFFTGFIGRDLIRLSTQSHKLRNVKDRSTAEVVERRGNAQVFVTLSLISFATLSYQMLSFLIQSYAEWGRLSSVKLPTSLFGREGILNLQGSSPPLYVWTWSKRSTLFQDFAETIVNDRHRFWWTQQALLYSMGWNIYMTVEGTRYQVPHLWAYFVLDQILPISFTQNLFCAAICLTHRLPLAASLKPAAPGDQAVVVFVYLVSLSIASKTVGGTSFFFVLFMLRLLLYVPYWMMKPTIRELPSRTEESPGGLYWQYRYSALVLAVGGMFLHIRQTQAASPLVATFRAIGDNPAVSALGYDYIIGVLSLLVYIALRQV